MLPLLALLIRTPWAHLGSDLRSAAAVQALWLSLWTATCTTAISVIIGVPLAWVLARREFAGRRLLRALVILPLVLPPVVGGVAMLLAFGRNGVIGHWLYEWFGVSLPKGASPAVVKRLHAVFTQALKLPDVRERLINQGFDIIGSTPEEFDLFVRAEMQRWSRVVKESRASVD